MRKIRLGECAYMGCMSLGTKDQEKKLKEKLDEAKKYNRTIIWALEETQKIYGYLPEKVLEEISRKLNKPIAELYSVASFYAEFSFSPKGKYPISVCLGTACYVNGAKDILDKIYSILNISEGETTQDGLFSIDETRCIGCCGMAPVLTVGDDVYGNVKTTDVEQILGKYKN